MLLIPNVRMPLLPHCEDSLPVRMVSQVKQGEGADAKEVSDRLYLCGLFSYSISGDVSIQQPDV